MTKKEEREIKKGYLNYEKPGAIARRLGLTNFDVSNFIKQHEKEWCMEMPIPVRKAKIKRCSLCDVIVSNEKPEPGKLYNTNILQHFIVEEPLQICYECLITYYRNTYLDNLEYLSDILVRKQNDDKLLDFKKYK